MAGLEDPAREIAPAGRAVLPFGPGESLAVGVSAGVHLLPDPMGQVFRSLYGFRRAADHLEALKKGRWEDDGGRFLLECLSALRDCGLLVSRDELIGRLGARPAAAATSRAPRPGIATVAWVTRDRPQLLRRSLAGMKDNLRRFDRTAGLAVFDDSPDESARAVLSGFAAASGLKVRYAGFREKQAFLERLVEGSGSLQPPEEVLRFALFGHPAIPSTPGANCNARLLDTTGESVLNSDDDVVLRLAVPAGVEQGIELCSAPDPTEVSFFPDREGLEAAVQTVYEDWLDRHESLLGSGGPDWVAAYGGTSEGLRLDRLGPQTLAMLLEGHGRVRLTCSGLYGDCGFAGPAHLLALDGTSRENLTVSREAYESAFLSREIVRGVNRSTVSEGGFFMSYQFAIDNRDLFPPFFPNGRLQDGIFYQTLKACHPDALQAFLPRLVAHVPEPVRRYTADSRHEVGPKFPELVLLLARHFRGSLRPAGAAEALAALGGRFSEAGSLGPPGFLDLAADLWSAEWSGRIGWLSSLLNRHRGPDFWARDVETHIRALQAHVRSPQPLVPLDLLAGGRSPEEAMRLARELIGKFGELLQGWPAVVERARQLKEEGRGPAVPLE